MHGSVRIAAPSAGPGGPTCSVALEHPFCKALHPPTASTVLSHHRSGFRFAASDVLTADLLTDAERTVIDPAIPTDSIVLARVVDHGGLAVFSGVHHRPIVDTAAKAFAHKMRHGLGALFELPVGVALPVDRLRDPNMAWLLTDQWTELADGIDATPMPGHVLMNGDGEPLVFVLDHFAIKEGRVEEVASAIRALPEMDEPEREANVDLLFRFLLTGSESGKRSLGGSVRFSKGALVLDTNSVARADFLRPLIEAACGDLVRHRVRLTEDPIVAMQESRLANMGLPRRAGERASREDFERLVNELLHRRYKTWLEGGRHAHAGRGIEATARILGDVRKLDPADRALAGIETDVLTRIRERHE